ncbi:MAG: hypothetical protein A2063_01735 [Gallionellales bacterium GWA2_60_142]|jgi:hypothetical protein|nr:MAG: hypothetical protein A2063_01735 [Gallionellales bacterium GWA2_60_142]HCI12396.1 hypothetical protein [Gallionellaceae bacterium]
MHRTYARIPAHFYRINLHTDTDNMTMALVPDQNHAHLIAQLLSENYGLRKGERIMVVPTVIRPVEDAGSEHAEFSVENSR